MFKSLRFRLPALFLVAIVLAGIVSTAIAVSVSRGYAQNKLTKQAYRELEREARGIEQIYTVHAGGAAPSSQELEHASGDRIFYVRRNKGIDLFPGPTPAYTLLPKSILDFQAILAGRRVRFEFAYGGTRFVAVAVPSKLGNEVFGALILARPKTRLSAQGWAPLIWRLLPAFLAGVLVAGLLGWYLSRRITRPVLELSEAADEVAEGRYGGVAVPVVPGGGEISHLSERFGEMAAKLQAGEELERNFLMTVSHELRTPLTAIRGHVEALLEGVVDDEDARTSSLETISLEAQRLERLVDDVLDLAKLDTHRFTLRREEVDMERLVDRAYSAFGEEARRRGIEYRRAVEGAPVIETDGDRVLQVISNLLSNAFRWTPDGGAVELGLAQVDGTIRVGVRDTGPGISAADRERIFRPFWSLDHAGTGLGLAVARELAAALGGSIELESTPGHGSRFELILPAKTAG